MLFGVWCDDAGTWSSCAIQISGVRTCRWETAMLTGDRGGEVNWGVGCRVDNAGVAVSPRRSLPTLLEVLRGRG